MDGDEELLSAKLGFCYFGASAGRDRSSIAALHGIREFDHSIFQWGTGG